MTKQQMQIKALNSLFERSGLKFFPDFLEKAQSDYEWASEELCQLALESSYKNLGA